MSSKERNNLQLSKAKKEKLSEASKKKKRMTELSLKRDLYSNAHLVSSTNINSLRNHISDVPKFKLGKILFIICVTLSLK